MDQLSNSSSDEDDLYVNSVTRLRALKKKRLEKKELFTELEELPPIRIERNTNDKNDKETNDDCIQTSDNCIQTRSMMVRSRKDRKGRHPITAIRRARGRRAPVDDLECEVYIVSEEQSNSIPETYKNDIISLSDDTYSEDDNYEIDVKVFWRSNRIDKLSIHRHDSFQRIFQHYADLEKVSINEILIMKKDKIVNRTDTPASLKLSIIDILDGGIVDPGMNVLSKENKDDDICIIKVQTANKKQSLAIPLRRDQKFKALFANCAEQLNVEESSLKLYFDGEQIGPTDTPESLDIEGEACVDLRIST